MHDYFYDFDSITDRWVKTLVKMKYNPRKSAPTENTFFISINDRDILNSSLRPVPSSVADLLDVAVMVFETDRRSKRRPDENHQLSTHKIGVRLPVRNHERFQHIHDDLVHLLHHFTHDRWEFDFVPRLERERVSSEQETIWQPVEDVEIALFSGGLDSTAGLINRVIENPTRKYVLVGGGAHPGAFKTQSDVLNHMRQNFPKTEFSLVQLRIEQNQTAKIQNDPDFRARGLAFMMVGAVVALAHGQNTLQIYENGIGAYNLPPRSSGVGLDHSLAVHPLSLQLVSKFISSVCGLSFIISNPFEDWTKAQMCQIMRKEPLQSIASLTVSCDKASYGHQQCGACSSCILRRQALLVAGVEDRTEYSIHSKNEKSCSSALSKSHLPSVLFGVQKIRAVNLSVDRLVEFSRQHPSKVWDAAIRIAEARGKSESSIIRRILDLHVTYADEWARVAPGFSEELIAVKRAIRRAKDERKALKVLS